MDNLSLFVLSLVGDSSLELMDGGYIDPKLRLAVYEKETIDRIISRLETIEGVLTKGITNA